MLPPLAADVCILLAVPIVLVTAVVQARFAAATEDTLRNSRRGDGNAVSLASPRDAGTGVARHAVGGAAPPVSTSGTCTCACHIRLILLSLTIGFLLLRVRRTFCLAMISTLPDASTSLFAAWHLALPP